jgi:hypothetical protein
VLIIYLHTRDDLTQRTPDKPSRPTMEPFSSGECSAAAEGELRPQGVRREAGRATICIQA